VDSNLDPAEIRRLQGIFDQNQGTYIRRLYEVNLRPEKFQGIRPELMPQYGQALSQVEKAFQNRNMRIQSAINSGRILPTDDMASLVVDDPAEAAVRFIADQFERSHLMAGDLAPDAPQFVKYLAKGGREVGRETRGNLFRLADGMLKDRSSILDEAPLLQEMMGVVRDPREAYLRTINDMSNTIASQKLYRETERALGKTDFQTALPRIQSGQRPIVEGGNITDALDAELRGYGYVKAGELNPENAFGGKFGSLSGDYIPVEVYNSLTTPLRSTSAVQQALAVSLQLKGLSQMSKTVLNPLSQVRNFLSNTFIVGANGLLGRNMGLFESGQVLTANALDSPEQFKLLRALADEGAIGQNIQLNELRRLLEEHTELGVSAMLNKAGNAFRRSKAGAPVRFMEKTYQLGDDYWKVVGALGEKARYGAALRRAGVDIDNVPPQVQQALKDAGIAQRTRSIADTDFGDMLAIDLVKQTMPTYSMVPEAIKALRRVPVMGNFMAFPAEIIRTSGNIVNRAVKEMGFKPTRELIDLLGEREAARMAREIRGIGAQRLTGYLSMATVAPVAMRDASHTILEVTPEEEELLEENAPYWTKGNTLMFLTKMDDKGQAEYVDLSYMLPYEFMLTPARAALQEYSQKGEVDANAAERILSSAWQGFQKFAEPFASEALAAERVFDVTMRQGRTRTGAEVYEPGEMWGDKLSKSLNHVAAAFMPGIIDQFTTVKGGEFVPGRVTRAVTGEPSKEGDPYSIAEEAGTMLTGIRPMRLNIDRSLGYAGGEYAANRSSAVQIFTGKADDNDASVEDVLSAYVRANEARRRHQAELRDKITKAQEAGMSRAQIFQALQNSGVSRRELNNIINNRYDPIAPSRQLIREISREVNVKRENRILQRLPIAQINELRRGFQNTPITPESSEDRGPASDTPLFGEPVAPQAAAPRSSVPAPQPSTEFVGEPTPVPEGEPQPSLLQRAARIAPTLFGGDLESQAANREIAER
jgi:hypothetical protein